MLHKHSTDVHVHVHANIILWMTPLILPFAHWFTIHSLLCAAIEICTPFRYSLVIMSTRHSFIHSFSSTFLLLVIALSENKKSTRISSWNLLKSKKGYGKKKGAERTKKTLSFFVRTSIKAAVVVYLYAKALPSIFVLLWFLRCRWRRWDDVKTKYKNMPTSA